ncbi:prophage tail fiber N-terminal domain-containing protein [Escherichia coli]|uniref:prophage tail fiber N-terminal domain-containing protein n=1 Tax=Escherichia coli TaxID=562 RepID=UPI000BE174CE|nr:prophage tail fiber N-terminal domain-containing protein [Escherichia coli]
MSVLISGVLINGAGVPMAECKIYLDALVNTSEVVTESFAVIETDAAGQYAFEAQKGKYTVHIKQKNGPKCCVGDISVYDDSKPGTLNDFLTALDEGDLKPDVVKRFEEMVAQAQQSAEAAAKSEQQAGQHVADAQKIKADCQTLADNVQLNAIAVAEDKQRVEQLASEVELNAGQVQQGVQSATDAVKKAQQAADDSASSAEESKNNADNAALSEQNAKSHADNAAGNAQQTAQDVSATAAARDDAERLANEAESSAQASGTARDESVDAAGRASQYKEAASSAATSAGESANIAQGHENNAAEYARQARISQEASADNAQDSKQYRDEAQQIVDDLKGSNASTTEKGLVQLCSDTDNDSEELAATPKAVKAVMDETKTKAPLDSPAFTGTPTTPTPPDDAAGLETANAAFVRKLLAALVGSSPEALDTLNELAAALGNDPNFATTVTNALAGKQPLNDVLTAVSQITPEENTLPYFSAEGRILLAQLSEKARALLALDTPEAMRTELELKAAATMEPQGDIRDRTPGRLALPGAFGFGYAFSQSERLDFNSDEKFLEWVKNATEGRYFIYLCNSKILPDRDSFTGIVDVNLFPSGVSNGNPAETDKGLFFYSRYQPNSDQSVFYAQYSSAYADGEVAWGLISVINLSLTSKMLSEHLSTMSGSGAYFQYPGIGVPVLAVYRGTTSGDKEIKIGLGDVVAGSRLGAVNIKCAAPTGIGSYGSTPQVGATGYTFPGRYMALSGARDSYGNEARICLFVRIE